MPNLQLHLVVIMLRMVGPGTSSPLITILVGNEASSVTVQSIRYDGTPGANFKTLANVEKSVKLLPTVTQEPSHCPISTLVSPLPKVIR